MSRIVRCLRPLLIMCLVQAAGGVHGEEWRAVPGSQGLTLQIDDESVRSLSTTPARAEVTWRNGSDSVADEFRSVVECSSFRVVNHRRARSSASAKIGSPEEPDTQVVYAYYGTAEGAVADFACNKVAPGVLQDLAASSMCEKSEYSDLPTCREGSDLKINTVLLARRTLDLSQVCGETSEGTQKVLHRYLDQANYCRDSACARKTVLEGLDLVSRDIEARANARGLGGTGASCRAVAAVTREEAQIAGQKAGEDALREYKSCTRSKIPEADDRSASPEQVAQQIHQACEPLFAKAVRAFGGDEHDPKFYQSMFPRLVADVARNRSKR